MKKNLNTSAVVNELKGASGFFRSGGEKPERKSTHSDSESADKSARATRELSRPTGAQSNALDNLLGEIRKAIKEQGKEVSYVRLTQTEKNQLSDVIYSYKRQGIRTSETEIGRIAINYLLEDYRANGNASILALLLASLHD